MRWGHHDGPHTCCGDPGHCPWVEWRDEAGRPHLGQANITATVGDGAWTGLHWWILDKHPVTGTSREELRANFIRAAAEVAGLIVERVRIDMR